MNGLRRAFLVVFVSVVSLALPAQVIAFDRTEVDILHYNLDYKMDLSHSGWEIGENRLTGSVDIRFRNIGSKELLSLPLIAGRLLRVTQVSDGSGNVLPFTQRLHELEDYAFYQANVVEIQLEEPLASGDEALMHLDLTGKIIGNPESGMLYTRETMDPSFTIIRSETLAYPAVAAPNWASMRQGWQDKFDWSARVEVPSELVVANGASSDVTSNGDKASYHYKSARPNSFFNLPIGPYKIIEVAGNRIFYLPGSEQGAARVAHYMQKALELFAQLLGPLDQSDGLAIIEIPEGFGSQSFFPTIIQTADAFNSEEDMRELFHELSHLWQAHDPDPHSPRIEEGLSTFLEYLVADKLQGTDNFLTAMNSLLARSKHTFEDNPEYQEIAMKDYGRERVTRLSYQVGAVFYYVLYEALGEQAFMDLMAGHRRDFQTNGSTIDELASYYQAHTEGNIQPILNDWLYSTKYVEMLFGADSVVDLTAIYAN